MAPRWMKAFHIWKHVKRDFSSYNNNLHNPQTRSYTFETDTPETQEALKKVTYFIILNRDENK